MSTSESSAALIVVLAEFLSMSEHLAGVCRNRGRNFGKARGRVPAKLTKNKHKDLY
jgi:hypothetical protein